MITALAHAGHSHDMGSMGLDHCTPVIIGAGIIIAILIGIIVYLITNWEPKGKGKRTSK